MNDKWISPLISVTLGAVLSLVVYSYQGDMERLEGDYQDLRIELIEVKAKDESFNRALQLIDKRLIKVELVVESNKEAVSEIRALRELITELKYSVENRE